MNCKTEFTFKKVYGHLDKVAEKCAQTGEWGGMADLGNTFGHIRWKKACEKAGIKPIYGVQLPVTESLQRDVRRYPYNWMTFIAKNNQGLQEVYELVDLSHQQFYYRQRITYDQINDTSDNIYIFSGVAPRWDLIEREVLKEVGPHTPIYQRKMHPGYTPIATIDNYYVNTEDKIVYEPFADERQRERKTYMMHIPTEKEWASQLIGQGSAIHNLKVIGEECNVEIPTAPMVTYIGDDDIEDWCKQGAEERGIQLSLEPYKSRYEREMKLIKEKDYVDYFLVVADLIRYAKTKMAVGPSRGSSAGSLVCYLMKITEIDPIEYDLYFERFIDINRFDLPDIDIDFQDEKRHLCLKYLQKKYGKECVAQIGNISKMKPKSAITRFAQALCIPLDDVQEVKDAMIERSGGDARANLRMEDTLRDSEVGKRFIENYPNMENVTKIESHASHTGVHAAGILVCNEPITNFCGINSRDKKRIAMLDKKDAEAIDLLKIDALGLRTLAVIASVCDQIDKPYDWMYEIPTDDPGAYKVFNDQRFSGIFQFEGPAVRGLAKQMPIENMEDVAALGALGRPGPLMSGGANDFIKYRTGKEKIKYLANHQSVIDATEGTYGTIIYQEQMLAIGRGYGKLTWKDTSAMRRAMSKSLGDEFFDTFKKKFIAGAESLGRPVEEAEQVWKSLHSFGSWSFNKSHAVSYGLVSYLCAYLKAHYPMEFTVACLNNSKNDQSAIKILRDAVEVEGVEYVYLDKDISVQNWSVYEGKLYGGLKTIHGIGPAAANKIVKFRREGIELPKGINKKLNEGVSAFKYLYPGKEVYGDYYTDPKSHGLNNKVSHIKDTEGDGKFTIIGCIIKKNSRDANEPGFVSKRGGKYQKGPTTWLNITIEDDTDSIMCKISISDYEKLGKEIAETGKEDKDWYMVYGNKINGWSLLFVQNIRRITR
ncbi:MAG: DNA polymerase III subunit alpha [bacterium]|nr:DNA polymerase III subunit alpha [bacterium]